MDTDVCCIGHITKDLIITPENRFSTNGGTAYYFAHAMRHLPREVGFNLVTSMAEKDRYAVDELRALDVDVTFFPSRQTVFFENSYGSDYNKRTQRVLAKADPFTPEQADEIKARFIHLGTLLSDDFSVDFIRKVSQKGILSVDVQGFLREVRGDRVYPVDWSDKEEVLPYVDILKLNEQEMVTVTGLKNPREVALRIASWGVKEVLLTLGSYGSLIYAGRRFYEIPAFSPSRLVDATGCGDTYATGYLYCRAMGMDYGDCGRFAAAMCTMKLEHNGPFDGSYQQVEDIIARGGKKIG